MTNPAPALVSARSQELQPFRQPAVLNTADAATYVGLKKNTLEKRRVYGNGPIFTRYSKRAVRYRLEDLDVWIAEHRAASTSEGELAQA